MVKSKITGGLEQAKLQFISDLQTIVYNYTIKEIIPQIEEDIKKLFDKTTVNWQGGAKGSQGKRTVYPKPSADFETPTVNITNNGDSISIEFTVAFNAKAGGQLSKLWYWLDFGVKNRTWEQDYPSAWFQPQSSLRTTPNSLDVNPQRSFVRVNKPDGWLNNTGTAKVEDGFLYVRKFQGDPLADIDATNWSKLIAEEIQKIYKRQKYNVTYTRKNPIK